MRAESSGILNDGAFVERADIRLASELATF
jgi:hypothetical protein